MSLADDQKSASAPTAPNLPLQTTDNSEQQSTASGTTSGSLSSQQQQQPQTSSSLLAVGPSSSGGPTARVGPPQRQSSIPTPTPNVLLSSVNANKQRQPMCPDCEKSLPNQIVFDKIELIIRKMQDEQNGLPVKTAKSFMTKIPSVFTGTDLIQWMMRNLRLEDQQEAIHLANLIASHGYIFPIEDHTLSIKNDCTFYRFQTPYLWPSNNMDPENTDYAVYLCKRTMQGKTRLELADYEAENLARLQKMFSRKWEFIFMQAESQAKVDKKRDKLERKVLDSQERAFWDVYRPVPGCVNTTELDIKKACRLSKSAKRCNECQKVTSNEPSVSSLAKRPFAGAHPAGQQQQQPTNLALVNQDGQHQAPSPSPEVAQMKGDQQVHRLSFRQTTQSAQQTLTKENSRDGSESARTNKRGEADDLLAEGSKSNVLESDKLEESELPGEGRVKILSEKKEEKQEGERDLSGVANEDGVKLELADEKVKDVSQVEAECEKDLTQGGREANENTGGEEEEQIGKKGDETNETEEKKESTKIVDCERVKQAPATRQTQGGAHHHHHHSQHLHSHPHNHNNTKIDNNNNNNNNNQQQQGQSQPHHHHHHHHHHHPHSHSHAQHAHHHHNHHHHHHHHRSCPHHHKQQQQQAAAAAAAAASKSAQATTSEPGESVIGASGGELNDREKFESAQKREQSTSSSKGHKCQGKCSLRSKQRSTGSVDQLASAPSLAMSRRKSECQRLFSMSENENKKQTRDEPSNRRAHSPSANRSTRSANKNSDPQQQQQQQQQQQGQQEQQLVGEHQSSTIKATTSEMTGRPASACCSLNIDKNSSGTGEQQQQRMTCDANKQTTAPTRECQTNEPGKIKAPGEMGAHLQRKSSLNIVRPSSGADQTAQAGSLIGGLAPNPTRKGSVSSAHQQRAQLKGAQSVCAPPSELMETGNPQELRPCAGLVRAGSATGRRNVPQNSSPIAGPSSGNVNELERELESLRSQLDRGGVKMSKVTQSYLSYFNQWAEYDPFIAQPLPSNPWQSDSTELWDSERQTKDVHCRRVRRWAFSLKELLNDPAGREQFHRFLEKEFSAENLKFWDAVQELKRVHARDVARRVEAIWTEYLAQDANCPINIDSKSYDTSKKNMAKNKNNRYIFDEAAGHVYQLMKNDSYPRYLRSDMYKDYKEASERRRPNQVAFDVFKPQITTLKHKFNF